MAAIYDLLRHSFGAQERRRIRLWLKVPAAPVDNFKSPQTAWDTSPWPYVARTF